MAKKKYYQCSLWQLFESPTTLSLRRCYSLAKSETISFKLRAYCQSREPELLDHIRNKTTYKFYKHVSKTSFIFSITVITITTFGQRLPYAREIWKRSFVSTVRPTVHTNPSRKRSFLKTLFKLGKFINACCSFWCGRKTSFENRHFSKTMASR